MKEWLTFMAVVIGWALVGRFFLELNIAHPIAIFVVWLVGFVWLVGYTVSGSKDADALTIYTAAMIGAPFAFAGLVILADMAIN